MLKHHDGKSPETLFFKQLQEICLDAGGEGSPCTDHQSTDQQEHPLAQ